MVETKHLTIMFTDIKGFTSKTSLSSRQKLHELLDLHDKLILPVFKKYDGTVVKTIGDAFLVKFESPTDAVLCGIEIQDNLDKHNEKAEEDKQIEVRVAINCGEVTIKKEDVFGEAVNIASRLEGIAEAGDIYFTESVYLSMNKAEIPTAEVGHRHFKGIPEEIKVYKVLREDAKKGVFSKKEKAIIRNFKEKKKWTFWRIIKWAAIILLILFIIGIITNEGKQEERKPEFRDKLDQLREKVIGIIDEAHEAINRHDERRARELIDRLHEFNEKLGYPEELQGPLEELEIRFEETFLRQPNKIDRIQPELIRAK